MGCHARSALALFAVLIAPCLAGASGVAGGEVSTQQRYGPGASNEILGPALSAPRGHAAPLPLRLEIVARKGSLHFPPGARGELPGWAIALDLRPYFD
jgi:hypothetical protein